MFKLIHTLLAFLLFAALSCGDQFGDINADPDDPAEVPLEFLLVSAQKAMADDVWDESMNGRFGLLAAQYWTQNNFTEESRYQFRDEMIDEYFSDYYLRSLRDLEEVRRLVLEGEEYGLGLASAYNKLAVADILQCWLYQHMTDIWGPIPYSQALKGAEFPSPAYDSQRSIYLSLLSRLEKARAGIEEGAAGFGAADLIYGGDMSKWKKFASALVLRVAMRMSDAEPALAQTAVETAWEDAFSENGDNAYFRYLETAPDQNPLYIDRQARGDADFCASDILVDKTLVALNDPRTLAYADARFSGGGYGGRPFGQSSVTAAGEPPVLYSQPSGAQAVSGAAAFKPTDVLAPAARMTFMNYAEVCFILAEALERGWNVPGTAAEWYDAGVAASMQEWGIADDNLIEFYLTQSEVSYATAPGNWKQKIGVQKWLALYMQGVQGWSEWRRLDFEKLEAPVGGALGDTGPYVAPMRLSYPQSEQTRNAAGYFEAVADLLGGPDELYTRVWWDVE